MGHIKTLDDADQCANERIEEEKKNIVREVEVIVERKIYLEIPKEVIRKVEVIKEVIREVIMDGVLAVFFSEDPPLLPRVALPELSCAAAA